VSLFDKRLILVGGKGGVGRSTVAAAIATLSASRGRKTLLFEANANDRYGSYFGKPPVGAEITQLAPNLFAVNTTPAAALEEYGLMILKFKKVYDMIFENRITKAFIRAVPGMDDYAVLGKAWYHTTEEKRGKPVWDTLVFDMPASGHSLSMLRIPWVIIDTVPEGPLTRTARGVQALLRDPARTSMVLVTLAEEMPTSEVRELESKLVANLGIRPQHLIVNQVYPDRFPAGTPQAKILDALLADPSAPAQTPDLAPLAGHADLHRARRALNQRYLVELSHTVAAPMIELPMVFAPSIEPQHVQYLATTLAKRLGPEA
jgi:anion-transporting  ArsA/GET3 family ATPase